MRSWHIHIEGQVQGVGFRPRIFLLAQKYELKGWVNNTTDGVHVQYSATEKMADAFYRNLLIEAPALARITRHQLREIEAQNFDDFQIVHSSTSAVSSLLLSPDFALCTACRSELQADSNRRKAYPFITCTHCGPRYSILQRLPYDRIYTAMKPFSMCPDCEAEYHTVEDRRYYSQTNSCPQCSIDLSLFDVEGQLLEKEWMPIQQAVVAAWAAGKTVAIKGIGGYLLTCAASDAQAIERLRKRKHRPSKPLALMFPSTRILQDLLPLKADELEALESSMAPIVLLDLDEKKESLPLAIEAIAPGLNQVGVMLPYAPLFELLLSEFGQAIVATSGNISHSPIVFKDKKALAQLPAIADLIVSNNREISLPQDDSVLRFSPVFRKAILLRRSRGYAPTYINANLDLPSKTILGMGAMLKSTFSFLHQHNLYCSQYLGDLESFDTEENYKHSIRHFLDLFQTKPAVLLCDKHPEYPSTEYAKHLAKTLDIPLELVPHHLAHFGAVLGENNLLQSEEAILGVIWDGTGLGEDGQIWGGEFFKYEHYDFLRCYHFDYLDFIAGDKMAKEPRIAAYAACWDVMGANTFLQDKFTTVEWQVYGKLLEKNDSLQTSSVGRIFDAVAALLGILDKQSFEGEAAMQLENLAQQYFNQQGSLDFSESYFMEGAHYYRIPTKTLMSRLIMDLQKGKAKDFIAAKFHFSLVQIIKIVAGHLQLKKIALSGGVFQNALLVDLLQQHLNDDFTLYFHQQLAPNDENISFGQVMFHQIQQYKKSFHSNKSIAHVFSDSR